MLLSARARSFTQGFPILSARPHPAPFLGSVPWRAEPATAHSHFYWGGVAFAKGSWRALESPAGILRAFWGYPFHPFYSQGAALLYRKGMCGRGGPAATPAHPL